MRNERILIAYDDENLDSITAVAYYKKLWVTKQNPLPGEDKKAFVEAKNKIASFEGTVTFWSPKKDGKMPDLDFIDKMIILSNTLTAETMIFLYKRFGKNLHWFDYANDNVNSIQNIAIGNDVLEILIPGLRGNQMSISAMLWFENNNLPASDMPIVFKVLTQMVTDNHGVIMNKKDASIVYNHFKKKWKTYNDAYNFILYSDKESEREYITKLLDTSKK